MTRMFSESRLATVSLEPDTVRAVLFDGDRPLRWGSAELGADLLQPAGVRSPQSLADVLRDLLKKCGTVSASLVVGLPSTGALVRLLKLPPAPGAYLDEAVRWAARREFPVSVEQLHLSWKLIDREGGLAHVLVVGVPKAVYEGVTSALRLARLRPVAIDLNILAMARLAQSSDLVAVQIERSAASMLVLRSGLPELLRTFTAPDLACSPAGHERLRDEIARTVQFQQSLLPSDAREQEGRRGAETPLVLSFPEAARQVVDSIPQSGLVAINRPGPFRIPDGFPHGEFMTNLGLASGWRRSTSGSLAGVDLLPRKRSLPLSKKQLLAVGACALAVVVLLPLNNARIQARDDAEELERRLGTFATASSRQRVSAQQAQEAQDQLKALEGQLEALGREQEALRQLRRAHAAPLAVALGALSEGQTVDSFNLGRGKLSMTGSVAKVEEVLTFRRKLQESGVFTEVLIKEITVLEGKQSVRFTIETIGRQVQ